MGKGPSLRSRRYSINAYFHHPREALDFVRRCNAAARSDPTRGAVGRAWCVVSHTGETIKCNLENPSVSNNPPVQVSVLGYFLTEVKIV